TYKTNNDAATARGRPAPYAKGAVIIILDAGTQYNARISDKGDVGLIEGLGSGAKLSSAKLLNRASSATLADMIVNYAPAEMTAEDIRKNLAGLERAGVIQIKDRDGRPMTIVHIALSRSVGLKNAPFENFGPTLDQIDTYFNITQGDAYSLYQAATLIVQEKFETRLGKIREALEK
ncbi:MAG: hypothetical protein JWN40_4997, partial [Phycisphaerales bacterium]|nr:hypothetical protein [Phycisphaerales bacterium]